LLSGASTLTFQVGADGTSTNQVSVTTTNLAQAGSAGLFTYNTTLTNTGTIDVTTQGNASAALANLDSDISQVSTIRSTFGAVQNRFEAVTASLQNYVENLTSSRSRIMDTDFASETAALTRSQILQQAGTAILAQANALPQTALTLLR
jgi:flagellin